MASERRNMFYENKKQETILLSSSSSTAYLTSQETMRISPLGAALAVTLLASFAHSTTVDPGKRESRNIRPKSANGLQSSNKPSDTQLNLRAQRRLLTGLDHSSNLAGNAQHCLRERTKNVKVLTVGRLKPLRN
ncbi:hypothetical protein AAG570_002359 [Ranatra chinensis]|uniref:Uncharacterized protein n=1 Tax=Ranatra chinensis TaxID=642074 RepID=A0ABD0Y7A8_9HEMI